MTQETPETRDPGNARNAFTQETLQERVIAEKPKSFIRDLPDLKRDSGYRLSRFGNDADVGVAGSGTATNPAIPFFPGIL